MPDLRWGLLGLALGLAVAVVRVILSRFRLRAGVSAVRRGRAVSVPVLVGSGNRWCWGRAFLDRADIVVVARRTHLRLARTTFRDAHERLLTAADGELLVEQRGFVDERGNRHVFGVVNEWAPVFDAQLELAPRSAPWWRKLLAAAPVWPLIIALFGLMGLVVFQTVWGLGRDVDATVVRVVEIDEDGYGTCAVRWGSPADASTEYAEIDCYEPLPEPGDVVRIRALTTPFAGKALDDEGTFEGLSSFTAGPAAISIATWWVTAATRLRRTPTRLEGPVGLGLRGASQPEAFCVPEDDLGAMLQLLADREGWDGDATPDAPRRSPLATLRVAVSGAQWWPAGLLALGTSATAALADLPVLLSLLGLGTVVAITVGLADAGRSWIELRRAASAPVTSEWDYRLVRTVEDEWCVLLFLGPSAIWGVFLDGPAHPPHCGRCGVQGRLMEGGMIHLRIGGSMWPTASGVWRVADDTLAEISADIESRLLRKAGSAEEPNG